MLSAFQWYRRLMGGTWHHGDQVERWGFDAGSMGEQWLETMADRTVEHKRKREQERIQAMESLLKWRA